MDNWPLVDHEYLDVETAGSNYILLDVPVFARNVSRLDLLSGEFDCEQLVFSHVVEHRGRSTVRLILMNEANPVSIIQEFADLGCNAAETRFRSLMTLDIPEHVSYGALELVLDKGRSLDRWDFEEGSVPREVETPPKIDSMEDSEVERLRQFYQARILEQSKEDPQYGDQWKLLQKQLIINGGVLVVPPRKRESCIGDLLDSGFPWKNEVRISSGALNDCHRNVAKEWRRGNIDSIGEGYKLSSDGLWRQHTWGALIVGTEVRILETTTKGLCYFGRKLIGAAAERFASAQLGA